MTVTQDDLRRLVAWLLEREDPRQLHQLDADESPLVDAMSPLPPDEVERVLQRANDEGLITRTDDGKYSGYWWCHPTVAGLRFIDAWPPPGREHGAGSWHDGHWGTHALPRLRQLEAAAPDDDRTRMGMPLYGGAPGAEAWSRLTDRWLMDAGYVAGRRLDGWGCQDLRLTEDGERVLAPAPDPMTAARDYLASGALRDAVIEAVEKVLGGRLRALAAKHNITMPSSGSIPERLATLNDLLVMHGVYDQRPWKVTIAGVLAQRNVYGHANDGAMEKADAAWVIACVERLLIHLPDAK